MYDRGIGLAGIFLREEPHLSTLGSHEIMADAFLLSIISAFASLQHSCVPDRHRRSTSHPLLRQFL